LSRWLRFRLRLWRTHCLRAWLSLRLRLRLWLRLRLPHHLRRCAWRRLDTVRLWLRLRRSRSGLRWLTLWLRFQHLLLLRITRSLLLLSLIPPLLTL
jgi:hypothetical protein